MCVALNISDFIACSSVILTVENDTLPSKQKTMNRLSDLYWIFFLFSLHNVRCFLVPLLSGVVDMFHFPNRQAHRTVCRSAAEQTIHLLPGKYQARIEPCFYFPLPVCGKPVHFRCSSRGCVAGHEETGEPQAELRQPETEPGGHEVAVRTGRSDQSVDAAVRVLSPPPRQRRSTSPRLNRTLFSSPVCRAASAVAWID